jgi:hypothetical protein
MLSRIYKNNEIVTIKLGSGEEIITKVVDDNGDAMTISKPIVLVVTPKGAAMTQFLMMQDMNQPVELLKTQVVCIAPANKTASDQYIQTTTGIKPAVSIPTPEQNWGSSFENKVST